MKYFKTTFLKLSQKLEDISKYIEASFSDILIIVYPNRVSLSQQNSRKLVSVLMLVSASDIVELLKPVIIKYNSAIFNSFFIQSLIRVIKSVFLTVTFVGFALKTDKISDSSFDFMYSKNNFFFFFSLSSNLMNSS